VLDEALRRNAQPMRDLIHAKHQLHKLHQPTTTCPSAVKPSPNAKPTPAAAAAAVTAAVASVPPAAVAVTTAAAVVQHGGGAAMASSVTVLASVRVSRRYVRLWRPLCLRLLVCWLCCVAGRSLALPTLAPSSAASRSLARSGYFPLLRKPSPKRALSLFDCACRLPLRRSTSRRHLRLSTP
jgi:hypothetical protein